MRIRALNRWDLSAVMGIWLETNISAHPFIPRTYWEGMYAPVEEALPQAEVYVAEDESGELLGFIGLDGGDIAGLFVSGNAQSQGIGGRLLDYAKGSRAGLRLHVYQKNTRAARFYRREGFSAQSEGVDEQTGEKEWVMVWHR